MPRLTRARRSAVAASAFAIVSALALSACASPATTASTTEDATPVSGGTLRIAYSADTASCIDPNQVNFIENRGIIRNFTDSLTDQDTETGEIVPWLAEDWTVNDTATEFVFNLRSGVTFSDGTPLDAASVKLAYDETVALGAKSLLGLSYLAGYESTTVVDEDTVRVDFSTPNAAFLQASSTTTLAILSPATYEKTPEERCAGAVVASGPFVLDSYTAGTEATLSRRADYAWPSALVENQGESYLDSIEFSYVDEDSVRVGSLTSGAIDIAWPRNPISKADQSLIESSGGSIVSRALPGSAYNYWPNVKNGGPLADSDVREALTLAIDRETYAKTVFWDGYPEVASVYNSKTPFYLDSSDELGYDPEAAAELLDEAGWTLEDDGYRYKGGEKLTLTLPSTAAGLGDQLIQAQLKEVGIDFVIEVLTAAQFTEALKNGDYDLTTVYQTRADPSVLAARLDQAISAAAPAVNSQDDATAATVSALFADGLAAVDADAREAAYAELQEYLLDENVLFPIYERVLYIGVDEAVKDFAFTSESMLRANDIWISKS